jgi:hypothetical protein
MLRVRNDMERQRVRRTLTEVKRKLEEALQLSKKPHKADSSPTQPREL